MTGWWANEVDTGSRVLWRSGERSDATIVIVRGLAGPAAVTTTVETR